MGLHAHLHDGAPMVLLVCVGSFRGLDFGVESGGPLNPSLRDKKRHTRVHKGGLRFPVRHARPHQRPQCCSIPGHYMPLCHGRVRDGV